MYLSIFIRGKFRFFGGRFVSFWGGRKYLQPMFPYRVRYTESESDIKNSNYYTKTPTTPNYFRTFGIFQESKNFLYYI